MAAGELFRDFSFFFSFRHSSRERETLGGDLRHFCGSHMSSGKRHRPPVSRADRLLHVTVHI